MKSRILGSLSLVLVATLPVAIPASAAQGAPNPPSLVAGGSASVSREPDVAHVSISVESNAAQAAAATQQNAELTAHVRSAVEGLGIAAKAIVTQYYNVRYQPRPEPSAPPIPLRRPAEAVSGERYGYVVTHTLDITAKPSQAGAVIDAATKAGATSIGGVSFDLADRHGAFLEALRAAVADAKSQAQAAAAAAGVRLGALRRIYVNSGPRLQPSGPIMMRAAASAVPTEVTPGAIHVYAAVSVTYDLLP
ncbi:MAG: SIMPL domain-containing protein [bacterium]|nr:SIMPL domain-containing protein [bacterium]